MIKLSPGIPVGVRCRISVAMARAAHTACLSGPRGEGRRARPTWILGCARWAGTAGSIRRLLLQLAVALSGLAAAAEVLIAAGPLSGVYVPYLFPAAGALYA